MSNELIKVEVVVDQIRYPKDRNHESGFTIATFKQDLNSDCYVPNLKTRSGSISAKGDMIRLKRGIKYSMLLKEGETHPQYGTTYEVVSMSRSFNFDKATPEEIKKFLSTLMTEPQLESYYEMYSGNPMEPFKKEDTKALEKVHGIGEVYSSLILQRYLETKDFSEAFIKLARYSLDPATIKLLLAHHAGDPELVEESIKKDPYKYMLDLGLPFEVCDKMYALDDGIRDSDIRLSAIMMSVLINSANEGDTWVTPMEVCKPVKFYVPDVSMKRLGSLLVESELFFVSEDRQRVSLAYYVELEKRVARKLIKLQRNSRNKDMTDYDRKIKEIENSQGWKFSEQQYESIKAMITNNVFLLEGYGGTGKTTVIKTVLDLMPEEFAVQCALSGKASDNLSKVTGRPGYTIKRLLMTGVDENGKLPHTIVVIDEFAMVDLVLLDELLNSVGNNIKLIMVGDCEQLEAIGIPVMKQLIETKKIPYMMFTEIHRQAAKSAIITDSIKIRLGNQFLRPEEQTGYFVHGELEDLHIHLMENESLIVQRALKVFEKKLKTEDVTDIQLIAQTKSVSSILNDSCKEIYNPINFKEPQSETNKIEKQDSNGQTYTAYEMRYKYINIRSDKFPKTVSIGDKVINTKNNYKTFKVGDINLTPIFNGNTGIIKEILEDPDFGKIMHIEFDGVGLIAVPEEFWTAIDLAYCITVHKSQGSSCKVIISVITSHKYLNVRQLLYTAITRVRDEGHLISTREALTLAVMTYNSSLRKNWLTGYYLECLSEVEELEQKENEETVFE